MLQVECIPHRHPTEQNPYVQDLFLKHLGQAIRMSDRKRPMPRESVKPVMTNSRMEAQGMIS